MRSVPSLVPSQKLMNAISRAGAVALLAGLGACSSFDSLRSPVFTGSTNQQEIITGQQASASPLGNSYVGTPTTSMQGADLPPPPGASAPPAYAQAPAYAPAPAYASAAPQAYTPPSSGSAPQ